MINLYFVTNMTTSTSEDIHDMLAGLNVKSDDSCTIDIHFRPGNINIQFALPDRSVSLSEMMQEATECWSNRCKLAESFEPELHFTYFLGQNHDSEIRRLSEKQILRDDDPDDQDYSDIKDETDWKKALASGNHLLILAKVKLHEKSRDPLNRSNAIFRPEPPPIMQRLQENFGPTETELLENYLARCNEIEQREDHLDNLIDRTFDDLLE
jgi:hypothetical protein